MSRKCVQGKRQSRSGWQLLQDEDVADENITLWPRCADTEQPTAVGLGPLRVALGIGSRKPTKSQLQRLQASGAVSAALWPATSCALKLALSPPPAPLREHNQQWYGLRRTSTPPTQTGEEEQAVTPPRSSPPKRLYFLNRDLPNNRTSGRKNPGAIVRFPVRAATTSRIRRAVDGSPAETTIDNLSATDRPSDHAQAKEARTKESNETPSCLPVLMTVDVTEQKPLSDSPSHKQRCPIDGPHSRNSSIDPVEFHSIGVGQERAGSPASVQVASRVGHRVFHHRKGSITYFRPSEIMALSPQLTRATSTVSGLETSPDGQRRDDHCSMNLADQSHSSPNHLHRQAEELLLVNVRFLAERVRELEERILSLEQENASLRHELGAADPTTAKITNAAHSIGDVDG
jgi:hypothetical protein